MLDKYLHQYHQENMAHPPLTPCKYQVPILLSPQTQDTMS